MRHTEERKNVPMYITNRPCESAGPFRGNLVVSMRPLLPGETCDMSDAPMRQCTNASCYTNGGWCTNAPMHQRTGDVPRATAITRRFPRVHGAPVHVGAPAALGIAALERPDFGDAVC